MVPVYSETTRVGLSAARILLPFLLSEGVENELHNRGACDRFFDDLRTGVPVTMHGPKRERFNNQAGSDCDIGQWPQESTAHARFEVVR